MVRRDSLDTTLRCPRLMEVLAVCRLIGTLGAAIFFVSIGLTFAGNLMMTGIVGYHVCSSR